MNIKRFSYLLLAIVLSSCVYEPDFDYKKLQCKTSYETFNSLSEPIVYAVDNRMSFSLYGNEKLGQSVMNYGNYLLIFDWKNNKVHDFVYVPGVRGTAEDERILASSKSNEIVKYYISDSENSEGYCIESSHNQVQSFPLYEDSRYGSSFWGNSKSCTEKYLIKYYSKEFDFDRGDETAFFRIINTENNTVKPEIEFRPADISRVSKPFYDNGKFWVCYDTKENPMTHVDYANVRSIDPASNKLDDILIKFNREEGGTYDEMNGWNIAYDYSLKTIVGDNLILSKNCYTQNSLLSASSGIITVNKSNKNTEFYEISDNGNESIIDAYNVHGNLYVLTDCNISDNYYYKLYFVNLENKTVNYSNILFPARLYTSAVRESKIYFFSYDYFESSVEYFYVNTEDSSKSLVSVITLSDLAK